MADRRSTAEGVLHAVALVEREVDRSRRAYDLFFDVFSQRGTRFAPALAACDAIAADCYAAVKENGPGLFREAMLKPITYLEHSVSPATFRRGVLLVRLLGERNPFPVVRVPYEQVEAPWSFGVLLHEVGHNLQADLGIWEENRKALLWRILTETGHLGLTRMWARWHKEIFADLVALLLGGPAAAASMLDFLSYPPSRTFAVRPQAVHPIPYVRGHLLAEMLRRMELHREAAHTVEVWDGLYGAHVHQLPSVVRKTAARCVAAAVDEVAYSPRRGLGQLPLSQVVKFGRQDQRAIETGAEALGAGHTPEGLPPRHWVGAALLAMERKWRTPTQIASTVLRGLAHAPRRGRIELPVEDTVAA
jgi:hypothetical protein